MKQEMIGWQSNPLDRIQIIRISLQTDNHASNTDGEQCQQLVI